MFSQLSDDALRALGRCCARRRYRKRTVIMEKGDDANALYVLAEGQVRVYVSDEAGKDLTLNVLEAVAHFGELGLLAEMPRAASVMTETDSALLVMSKSDFRQCVRDYPDVGLDVMRHLATQIAQLVDQVEGFGLGDVYSRTVGVLKALAQDEDGRLITPRVTQQAIAQRVGASREMVSRILKTLREGHYIAIEQKRIVLLRPLPAKW